MKEGIARHIESRTDEQLYTILFLDDPENWQPEALLAARAEWERRGLQGERLAESKVLAETQKKERDSKADAPLSDRAKVFFFFCNFTCCLGIVGITIANSRYRQHGYERKFWDSLIWMAIGLAAFIVFWAVGILMPYV